MYIDNDVLNLAQFRLLDINGPSFHSDLTK